MNGSAAKDILNCDLESKTQSRKACQAIMRLIAENSLKEGDSLPNQKELIARLSICANTLSMAIQILSATGILEAKRKTGTKIKNLSPGECNLRIWNVGVALYAEPGGEFVGLLQHYLRRELASRLCADFSFFLYPNLPGGEKISSRSPEDFINLASELKRGKLDMVITPTRLLSKDIPVYSAPAFDDAPDGIRIDSRKWLSSALERLCGRGARRIAFVCRDEPSQGHFKDALNNYFDLVNTRKIGDAGMLYVDDISFEGGVSMAKALLAKPEKLRPDALIISSDIVASGLLEAFSLSGKADAPMLAIQCNKDSARRFPPEVLQYELDIEKLAKEAVGNACAWLARPSQNPGISLFELKLRNA